MKVLIITGGTSSERTISLMSARNVSDALKEVRHQVKTFDLKKGFAQLKILAKSADVVFPVIHGREGEDGSLYKYLVKLGRPYVGCSPKSTKIAFDKILFNRFCLKNNISQPTWKIVKNIEDIRNFGFPCVLKAACGGSSKEVAILQSEKDVRKKIVKKIFSLKDKFLVEKYIDGIEITVAVFLDKALPVIEIIPPEGGWFDYKNKYNGQTQEIIDAPSIDKKVKKLAQKIALKIHQSLNLFPYSRTDFMVSNSIPYVLEVNPANGVGLTKQSLLPKAAKAVGISFPKLMDQLIKLAL